MAGEKKQLTPKQISSGISYIQKEAPFLARLKNKTQEKERAQCRFENYEDGQDDDDYDELEGAQVVELDEKGKEIHKDAGEKDEKEEEQEEKEEEQPAVDENGRILFRKQKSSINSKRKLKSIIDEEIIKTQKNQGYDESEKKKKKNKKKKMTTSLLSFGDNATQDE